MQDYMYELYFFLLLFSEHCDRSLQALGEVDFLKYMQQVLISVHVGLCQLL